MPPKKKFSKEQIIDAAFEIARIEGLDQITIRKVAEKMGGSIAPIYVNFTDVQELKQAVLQKIHALAHQMMMTPYHANPFLNLGIASLKFAREYSVLFRDLIMNNNRYLQDVQPSTASILELMRQDAKLGGFTDAELTDIFFKLQVFQLGLSVMDVNGLLPENFEEEALIQVLERVGGDVIAAARLRQQGTIEKETSRGGDGS